MKIRALSTALLVFTALVLSGCNEEDSPPRQEAQPAPQPKVEAKKVEVGKNVFLEIQGDKRRVLVSAYVCLRQGQLEQFLTRKRTKEHEAIVAADIDARDVHTALILSGAEPGKPVQFRPKFKAASGTTIKVNLEFEDNGKKVRVPASHW